VVLDEQLLPLSTILDLKVGDRIALGVAPGAPVRLRCGEIAMFEGELGRQDQRLAVRIAREFGRARSMGV
jgi:flagellar motor switch protein FliM